MTAASMTDNLIEFRPADMESAVRPYVPGSVKACSDCKLVWLNEHKRNLECRRCGKILDPFDWMLRISRTASYEMACVERLKREMEEKSKELADLKRQIQNAKATLKRATV